MLKEYDRLIKFGYKAIDAETGKQIDVPTEEVTVIYVASDGIGFKYIYDENSAYRPNEIWETRFDIGNWCKKNEKQ